MGSSCSDRGRSILQDRRSECIRVWHSRCARGTKGISSCDAHLLFWIIHYTTGQTTPKICDEWSHLRSIALKFSARAFTLINRSLSITHLCSTIHDPIERLATWCCKLRREIPASFLSLVFLPAVRQKSCLLFCLCFCCESRPRLGHCYFGRRLFLHDRRRLFGCHDASKLQSASEVTW